MTTSDEVLAFWLDEKGPRHGMRAAMILTLKSETGFWRLGSEQPMVDCRYG